MLYFLWRGKKAIEIRYRKCRKGAQLSLRTGTVFNSIVEKVLVYRYFFAEVGARCTPFEQFLEVCVNFDMLRLHDAVSLFLNFCWHEMVNLYIP